MANTCSMCITFFCDGTLDNAGLLALHKQLSSLGYKGTPSSLLSDEERKEIPDMRGEVVRIDEMSADEHSFTADIETAWKPNHELITTLCGKFLGVSYASASDEENEDLFEVYNDPERKWYPQEYSIDVWGDSSVPELYEFLNSEEETYKCLKTNFGHLCDGEDIDEFDDFLGEHDLGHVRHWYRMMPSDYNLEKKGA